MNLWSNLPERLVDGFPLWKAIYVFFFAVDMALANVLPTANTTQLAVQLTLLFFASVFILSSEFVRRIASGQKQLQLLPEYRQSGEWRFRLYRLYSPLTRYVLAMVVFLAAAALFGQLVDTLLPSFSADQNLGIQSGSIGVGLVVALLGCLEEYWRWAMIVAVLLMMRRISARNWQAKRGYRRLAMAVALVVSSLLFGLGHVEEFTRYRGWSLVVLGGMGLLLALAAIVTRRFLVAVAFHYIYDFLAISNLFDQVVLLLYALAILSLVILIPLFWYSVRRLRPYLNQGPQRADPAR